MTTKHQEMHPTEPDYARKPGSPDVNPDGHNQLRKHLPECSFYRQPKWLGHRCRDYAQAHRKTWTDFRGKVHFHEEWPKRSLRMEFCHFRESAKFASLFDHWGALRLPDGRIALHSSPYLWDAHELAMELAAALGLELLSRPGDLSHYGYTTSWFLWAEPLAPAAAAVAALISTQEEDY